MRRGINGTIASIYTTAVNNNKLHPLVRIELVGCMYHQLSAHTFFFRNAFFFLFFFLFTAGCIYAHKYISYGQCSEEWQKCPPAPPINTTQKKSVGCMRCKVLCLLVGFPKGSWNKRLRRKVFRLPSSPPPTTRWAGGTQRPPRATRLENN